MFTRLDKSSLWLKVMTDLKTRGVQDILIAVVDGLKGFPQAIEAVFPQTQVQSCIVHLTRHALSLCSWQERKEVAKELRKIYHAPNAEVAYEQLLELEQGDWGKKYPTLVSLWKNQWPQVIPFFAYPPEIRKIIYTTNAIESLHMRLRKIIKTRGHFPNDEAATKLLYLALRNITKDWNMPPREWSAAKNHFAILFEDRFQMSLN